MKENNIDAKRIRLGKLTYFDVYHNGSILPPVSAYVFMVNINGTYINPFDLSMELPVYDRVPYGNCTREGLEYGTKIRHVQGEIETGPCVVLEKIDIGEYLGEEAFSINSLKKYMMKSNKFFIDRVNMHESNNKNPFKALDNRLATLRQREVNNYLKDKELLDKFNSFINECEEEYNTQITR